jgi:hypothetical protein
MYIHVHVGTAWWLKGHNPGLKGFRCVQLHNVWWQQIPIPHCSWEKWHLSARSRRFRILARKIEFGVFRLFRMRKKIFSWKNRGFWWISILFPHIIRKSVRNCPNELGKIFGIVRILRIDVGKKFGIVRILRMTSEKNSELSEYSELTSEKNSEFGIKVGNYHPYSENIVRFGNYSKLALRKFPH